MVGIVATSIDGQTVQSEAGYLNVIGASILSYNDTLVLPSKQGRSDDINTVGLTEMLEKAIKQSTSNDMLRKGSIDNIIIMDEDSMTCQWTVSFNVRVQYDYSLTQSIADQAIEASQHHSEVLDIIENLQIKSETTSIPFVEFDDHFIYVVPQSFETSEPIYTCPGGKQLMDNTFICCKGNVITVT